MDTMLELKNKNEDFEVEFELMTVEKQSLFSDEIDKIDNDLNKLQERVDELNTEIDRLTNHADGIDYMVAVGSGILAGILDVVFVEDLSLDTANEIGNEKAEKMILKIAKKTGYGKDGDDLSGAVRFLESKFPLEADKATSFFGGGKQHHLRDFSHHPTPIGLFFSLLTQFTGNVYGTDVAGAFTNTHLNDTELIGNNLPEKILFGLINWFFHMVSDIAGSSGTIYKGHIGAGLPGPIESLLKEFSALPFFKNTNEKGYKEFSVYISKLYNGTLLAKRDEDGKILEPVKFDLRTEIGIATQLGKQAIPVIVNECLVRGFYFIRRVYIEMQNNNVRSVSDLKNINWKNTLPFKNRTVVRMLTISTGTMTAIDLADAAIESAVKSDGVAPAFLANMIMKVNFVGIGRFVIAFGTDVAMGIKRSKLRNERIKVYSEMIALTNAKVFYKEAEMWHTAEETGKAIEDAYKVMENSVTIWLNNYRDIQETLTKLNKDTAEGIRNNNPGLLEEVFDLLD